ncbi:DUF5615 family PIN-like protein [Limnochorda pilosa]|uniref:DUF5615 domain-containing protein n=1 Tax=Limnochorda pilosa TaxID=1555112 RepID=A0A0K2SMD0_LIMPI|nr:DUF5615 family PIN-like protein [Limnochorda pilosa]BAS27989.1 hypothetical protein LIP_2148 [Limnochorda pilosa]
MRIKIDENLPTDLARELAGLGHDVDTVRDEAASGKPDGEVWDVTRRGGRFFIAQDLDFFHEGGKHEGERGHVRKGFHTARALEKDALGQDRVLVHPKALFHLGVARVLLQEGGIAPLLSPG